MATVASIPDILEMINGSANNVNANMKIMMSTVEEMYEVASFGADMDQSMIAVKHQVAAAEIEIDMEIGAAAKSQEEFNQNVVQGGGASNRLLSSVKGWAKMFSKGAKSVMGISDEYTNTISRLNMINDGLQTTHELQDKVFAASNRVRGNYADTVNVISKMGMAASESFGSNDELIAFTELMQKSFKVGGASAEEQAASMNLLTEAMASGQLQGEQFQAIMGNSPVLAQAIADFTGKSMSELGAMSAEGLITADMIKGALFAASDEINEKFGAMPKTFGETWNVISNNALQAFGPALEKINDFLNSQAGQDLVNGISQAFSFAASMIGDVLDAATAVLSFFIENWGLIEPIVLGVATAFGAWLVVTRMQAIAQGLLAIKAAVTSAVTFAQTVATLGLATAWKTLNKAMKANIFILLISLIVGLILWLINLWKTNDDFVAGFKRAWNSILNFFEQIPIFFTRVWNGVINTVQWLKVSFLTIFETIVNGVIDALNWVMELSNDIFGTSFDLVAKVDYTTNAVAEAEVIRQAGEEALKEMEENAALKAAQREQEVVDFLADRAASRAKAEAEAEQDFDSNAIVDSEANNIDKVNEVGRINDSVDVSSEDLKTMRELAEMKSIQNFVTLQPNFSVQTGDIHENADLDVLITRLDNELKRSLAESAEGVYA